MAAATVIVALLIALAAGLASERRNGLITHQPYNNLYSDATAARDSLL
jgi:hypothetical protein